MVLFSFGSKSERWEINREEEKVQTPHRIILYWSNYNAEEHKSTCVTLFCKDDTMLEDVAVLFDY